MSNYSNVTPAIAVPLINNLSNIKIIPPPPPQYRYYLCTKQLNNITMVCTTYNNNNNLSTDLINGPSKQLPENKYIFIIPEHYPTTLDSTYIFMKMLPSITQIKIE